jgi:WD40 repeat protein
MEPIGRGGMGLVFKARQRSLDRVVALKFIEAGPLARKEMVQRFRQEAQAAARLQHPNILAVHEVGEADGQHFYSMDLVEGRSLAEMVREHPLSGQQAASYVKVIAEAIHHAHEHGILHRDLKPANILIDASNQPRVADFGLAKWAGITSTMKPSALGQSEPESGDVCDRTGGPAAALSDLTSAGHVLGSPSYLAPEQAAGRNPNVDGRADVYALGAILFELLTGTPPFRAETPLETLRLVLETDPVPLRLLNSRVPQDLEVICLKCLMKDPARRYPTARLLAEELGRFLRGESVQARPRSWLGRVSRWCCRHPAKAAMAAAIITLSLLGTVGIFWQWQQADAARRIASNEQARAQRAEQSALEKLWESYVAQARANRRGGRSGRRFESLAVLAKAAAIHKSVEVRNEVIACLALPDVQTVRKWTLSSGYGFDLDYQLNRFARGDKDGNIRICQVGSGAELLRLPSSDRPQGIDLKFSPDGRFLAEKRMRGSGSTFRVWDLARQQVILQPAVEVYNFAVKFARDSEAILLIEADGRAHGYSLNPASESIGFMTLSEPNDLSFDGTSQWLAVCSETSTEVRIFDAHTGLLRQQLEHPAGVHGVCWHPQGDLFACAGMDHNVYLWHMPEGTRAAVMTGHTAPVTGLAFSPKGDFLVSASWDGTSRFWDPALDLPMLALPEIFLPRFSEGESQLGFQNPPVAGIWQITMAPECRRLGRVGPVLQGNCASFDPRGRLLALATRAGTRVWDLASNRRIADLPTGDSRSAIFDVNGRNLMTSGMAGVQRWPVMTNRASGGIEIGTAETLWTSAVEHACLSPDGGRLIATGVAEPSAGALILPLDGSGQPKVLPPNSNSAWLAIHPDGRRFATGNWKGQGVRIWNISNDSPVMELPCGANVNVAFSPDGRWLLTASPVEYRFWDTQTWQRGPSLLREQAGDTEGAMAFSSDGRMLAVVRDRYDSLRLIRLSDFQELATFEAGLPLCFNADGSLLATLSEDLQTVLVWDLPLIRRQLAAMNLDWEIGLPP